MTALIFECKKHAIVKITIQLTYGIHGLIKKEVMQRLCVQ
jgi:hypothetical protein